MAFIDEAVVVGAILVFDRWDGRDGERHLG
jgi:hypothetical protein